MKKFLFLLLAVTAGFTALPSTAEARPRSRVIWEVVDGRPTRRVVYFEGDRPYYQYRGERRWVRNYYSQRPRYVIRDGRREWNRPAIQLNF